MAKDTFLNGFFLRYLQTDKRDQLIFTNSMFSMDSRCNDVLHPAEVSGRPLFYLLFHLNLVIYINHFF